jgi:aryl-alcohol dehydrogenase-like predicted oxidoreductase
MEKRSLGRTDIEIAPILVGTWQAGKRMWTGIDDGESIRAIRAAYEAGITTVDTAEVYGEGHSEQIVGRALGDVRDRVVYCTKVFANHLHYSGVIEARDRSLKNLNTDYIDLYRIHRPSGTFNSPIVPIEETPLALNDLKEQGKIRAIGVSNFNRTQLEEASRYGRIESLQPPYSLFLRGVEKELAPYCIENQISILAYSPLAQGLLTGKFREGFQLEEGDHRAKNKLFQGENFQRVQKALDEPRPSADRHGCSLAQLALAWPIRQPRTHAIAGVRNATQAIRRYAPDNAAAMTVDLSPEDVAEIDSIGRRVTDFLDDNPVMREF